MRSCHQQRKRRFLADGRGEMSITLTLPALMLPSCRRSARERDKSTRRQDYYAEYHLKRCDEAASPTDEIIVALHRLPAYDLSRLNVTPSDIIDAASKTLAAVLTGNTAPKIIS